MDLINLINKKLLLMDKKESDRVVSFSIKPENKEAIAEINKLKAHAKKTGITFSFFMIAATKKINKELKLK